MNTLVPLRQYIMNMLTLPTPEQLAEMNLDDPAVKLELYITFMAVKAASENLLNEERPAVTACY